MNFFEKPVCYKDECGSTNLNRCKKCGRYSCSECDHPDCDKGEVCTTCGSPPKDTSLTICQQQGCGKYYCLDNRCIFRCFFTWPAHIMTSCPNCDGSPIVQN